MKKAIKDKYYKLIVLVFCLLMSCDLPYENRTKYTPIDSNCELNIIVEKAIDSRGLIINDEYYYGGGTFLQYNNDYPIWLLQKNDMLNLQRPFDKDSILSFDIWNIKTPYKIYKKANSNVLFLIKNNDTLKFRTL